MPGDVVRINGGTYTNRIILHSRGTERRPIVVRAEPGAIFTSSIILDGAAFVHLDNFHVTDAVEAAVVLENRATQNVIMRATLRHNGLGVLLINDAGAGNVVEDSEIVENRTHGIAVDRVDATSASPGIFRRNLVAGNGYHGIDIYGSHYRVEGNRVIDNGGGIEGTSGIHVYAHGRGSRAGQHNVIRGNVVSGQRETTGRDGNGIQIDTWCDHNDVMFNLVFGNDGAGINIYDGSFNRITNNTLAGNMVRDGSAHVVRGELVIASDEVAGYDHAHHNVVANNIFLATHQPVASVALSRAMTGPPAAFSGNILQRIGDGPLVTWGALAVPSIGVWNAMRPGAPDRAGDPGFAFTTEPSSIATVAAFRPLAGLVMGGFPGLPPHGAIDLAHAPAMPGLTGALMPGPAPHP